MIDPFGRHISYLRVSVTDRCDFRCVYCMAEDMTFLPKAEVLSLEELERLLPPAEIEYVEKRPSLEEVFLAVVNGRGDERGDERG